MIGSDNLQKHSDVIINVSEASTKSGGILAVLRTYIKEVVHTLGYGRVIVALEDKRSSVLRFKLGTEIGENERDFRKMLRGILPVSLTPDDNGRLCSSAYAFKNRCVINVVDSGNYDFNCDESFQDEKLVKKLKLKAYLILPISFKDECIGIVIVDNKHISRPFSEKDISILKTVSDSLAVSIVNARKYDNLKKSNNKIKSLKKELLRSQRMYWLMVERGTDAIFILQNYKIVFANKMLLKILGYEEEEIIGREFLDFVTVESKQHLFDSYENAYRDRGQTTEYEYFALRKDGSRIAVWMKTSLTRYNNQLAILCFARDITEKKEAESELKEAKEYLENLLESANDIIYVLDREGRFTYVNTKMEDFGYQKEDLLGSYFLDILSKKHKGRRFKKTLREGVKQVYEVEMFENNCDIIRNVVISTSPLFDDTGEIEGVLVVGKDISDRKKAEKRLIRLSITDSLTGLYNKRHFYKVLKEKVGYAKKVSCSMCLIIMDIDDFKIYNDTYGHLAGDEVLRALGKITTKSIRCDVDYAFRYGGDEFAIILPNASKENAENIARRIAKNVEEDFKELKVSIGISSLENHKSMEELINAADNAMYSAKNGEKIIFESAQQQNPSLKNR